MPVLADVGMIAADTTRSRAYLRAMVCHDLRPAFVLVLDNAGGSLLPGQGNPDLESHGADTGEWSEADFDPASDLQSLLCAADIPYALAPSKDMNNPEVLGIIADRPESVFVYSGFGGVLLQKNALSIGKRFLHVHGGYLPDFKGSTTNYYSLLVENTMGASAIFLTEEIDSGPVLHRRKFTPPENRQEIDHIYDSAARAKVLVEVLAKYAETGVWTFELENNHGGETYYVIHPLLKHLAILAKDKV